MTSRVLAKWIRYQRTQRRMSLKKFCSEFNDYIKEFTGNKKYTRTYGWFQGLEKYEKYSEEQLKMLSLLGDFFGYKLGFVKHSSDFDKETKEIIVEEETEEKILNKNW